MAAYLHDIPSVQDRNPALPVALGTLDLNRRIQQGSPVVRGDLVHARAVAKALRGIKGEMLLKSWMELTITYVLPESGDAPLITDEVVESAELRASVVEASRECLHRVIVISSHPGF